MVVRLRTQFDWGLILAMLLPLIAILPTWGDGIAAAADVAVHVHRIHAMSLALQDGILWPRWISYLHLGYGYPIFNFYAPGYAYVTALFELAGLHITTAYNLANTLAWSFGSVGMYLLARRFLPGPAALLAAALWAYAPSRLYEVWWQGSLAQIVAASLMPYFLLGILKSAQEPTLRRILMIAFPFAALILSHTPMTYISGLYAAPLAFVAPLWMTGLKNRQAIFKRWLYIGAGFVLAIGLASIFLIPMVLELSYVLISHGLDETVNFLTTQYLPPGEIFTLPRLIDRTDLYLDLPRTLGLVGGVLSIFGATAALRRKQYGFILLNSAGLAFTIFMLLDVSFPVWLALPSFANLRFPARLLRMGAVLIALMGGASILLLPKRYQITGMGIGIALVVAQVLPITKPYDDWLNWGNISALDEIEHERQDRTWGTVSYDEFNPVWGERIFHDIPTNPERYIDEPFHLRVFGRDIAALDWQGLAGENLAATKLRVTTDEARSVRFRQYYFPGWFASVNDERAEIYPDDEIGLITIDLPPGEHIVELRYIGTGLQKLATAISLISLVIGLALFRLGRASGKSSSLDVTMDVTTDNLSFAVALGTIGMIIIVALFNHLVIQPNNWLKLQSQPDDPAYMQSELDAVFGEQIALLGYTLHSKAIGPNHPLNIDLYWQVPEAIADNFRPQVQLISLNQEEAWAVSAPLQLAAGETSTFTPNRFARDPHRLRLIKAETPPFVGRIMVQMIGEDGPLTLAGGSDRVLLEPIIRIHTTGDAALESVVYQIGTVAELQCIAIQQDDEQFNIELFWHFTGTTNQEYAVMLHGLDQSGEIVVQADGPPFAGNYPSTFWREGQILREQHTLPADAEIESIAIGLYERDTIERLPVTQSGETLSDNRILLPATETTCSE